MLENLSTGVWQCRTRTSLFGYRDLLNIEILHAASGSILTISRKQIGKAADQAAQMCRLVCAFVVRMQQNRFFLRQCPLYYAGDGLRALFVCLFVALCPKSTAMVIAGRSVHLITRFPGQA